LEVEVIQKTVRERLLASTIVGGALALTLGGGAALAQDVAGQVTEPTDTTVAQTGRGEDPQETTEAAEVEAVVVTGSRIQRPNLSAPTPVQVIGQAKLEGQGYENVTDVLTTLPQFAAAFGVSRSQSTFSGVASSGLNLTNLRNLGSQRSLTLINGRRFPAGDVTQSAVDFNMIPTANIERIDVITGGASAVYGADAVAGVVNIITDNDFSGVEVGASYGFAMDKQDNINPSAYIRMGTTFDRGHFSAIVQYDYQGLVRCADRFLCAEDFFWSPPAAPIRGPSARSGVPAGGRFFVDGVAGSFTIANGAVVPFNVADHGFNRNAQRTLAIPTERLLFASDGAYEFGNGLEAFIELNYGSSETDAPFEGHPFQSSADLFGALQATIPTTNPFVPAALRATALAAGDNELTYFQRFGIGGTQPRGAKNLRQTARIALGVRGDMDTLFGLGQDWNYEASYVYGRTTLDASQEGSISREALYNGFRVEPTPGAAAGTFRCADANARAFGCIPINPFDGFNAAESAYLNRATGARGFSEMEVGQAFLSGSLVDLWAGPLGVAIGVESRRVTAELDYSTDINLGTVTGNQIGDNVETTFRTNDIYAEAILPLARDLPFANEINLETAYRVSDSANFGQYETYKIGGDWVPVPGVRFRVMKNKAVRTPVLDEVTGIGQNFGVVQDPCTAARRNANATRAANCTTDGVPANYTPPITVEQGVGGFGGGNPNLQPEEADTLTYGVVFQASQFAGMPDLLQGLTVTVDRFEIETEGLISGVGRQNIANLCYDTAGAGRAIFCNQIVRSTDPTVPGANYVLKAVNDQVLNIASLNIAGVDLQVGYVVDLADVGVFGGRDLGELSIDSTFVFYDKAEQIPLPGQKPVDLLGFAGGSTSDQGFLKRQGTTTVRHRIGKLTTTYVHRYIGEAQDSPFSSTKVTIDAHNYHDLQLRYGVTDRTEVYVGMNNIADTEPPFFPSGTSGTQALDTIPAYYDVFGRQLYFGFKARF
jgi:outer membrane receptor protein involved in Fe transport